jgi:hypothetical protein
MSFNSILARRVFLLVAWLTAEASLYSQLIDAPKPEPDLLIFTSGEKLIGHLVRSTGGKVLPFTTDITYSLK